MKENGAAAFIHKNRNHKKPVDAFPDELKEAVIDVELSDKYEDANLFI